MAFVELDATALPVPVPNVAVAGNEMPQHVVMAIVVVAFGTCVHHCAVAIAVGMLRIIATVRSQALMAAVMDGYHLDTAHALSGTRRGKRATLGCSRGKRYGSGRDKKKIQAHDMAPPHG